MGQILLLFHLDLQTVGSLSSFTYTADAIRRHGAIASVELSHSGQYAGTYLTDKDKKKVLAQWGRDKGLRVTQEGIVCEDEVGTEQLVPGTTVICALGQRARRSIVDGLMDCAPYVAEIGDCVKVSTITTAVYQGYHAALDI